MKLSKDKKIDAIDKVNALLEQLDHSVSKDNAFVKTEIQKTYNQINKPEKVTQKYKQIPDAVKDLNWELQDIAVAKKYKFSDEQNKIINELRALSRGSLLDSSIGVLNGVVFH